jgi:hypothetical protein
VDRWRRRRGATAAVLGLIGCWVTLWRIKSGTCRSDHHLILLLLAFWPVVIAIAVFSLVLYLMQVDTTLPQDIPNYTWQPFLFFLLSLLVPSLAGLALWKWVGTEGVLLKSRLWSVAACVLVVVSALAAKISYIGAGHLRGYIVEAIQFSASSQDQEGQAQIKAAMKEAAGPFADHYSVHFLTKPTDGDKIEGFFAEVEIAAASRSVAYQHWENLKGTSGNPLPPRAIFR